MDVRFVVVGRAVGCAVFEDVRQRRGLHAGGQRGMVEVVRNVFGDADFAVVQFVQPGQLFVSELICVRVNI